MAHFLGKPGCILGLREGCLYPLMLEQRSDKIPGEFGGSSQRVCSVGKCSRNTHRSIRSRWDIVRENFRNATPCFILVPGSKDLCDQEVRGMKRRSGLLAETTRHGSVSHFPFWFKISRVLSNDRVAAISWTLSTAPNLTQIRRPRLGIYWAIAR